MSRLRCPSDSGFTLVEMLITTAIVLLLLGGMTALVNPASQTAVSQPDAADAQQRLRAAAAAIYRDLYGAGAGLDAGLPAGPLVTYLPPILPRRVGAVDADAPESARPDAVTVLTVPARAAQSVLAAPLTSASAAVQSGAWCAPAGPACGFASGAGVLLFDAAGRFDL